MTRRARFSFLMLLALAGQAPFLSGRAPEAERTGRLMGTSLEGHGPSAEGEKKIRRIGGTLGWVYCLESDAETFTASSKKNPRDLGLAPGDDVRFTVGKRTLRLRDKQGKAHDLVLRSRSTTRHCP